MDNTDVALSEHLANVAATAETYRVIFSAMLRAGYSESGISPWRDLLVQAMDARIDITMRLRAHRSGNAFRAFGYPREIAE